MSRREEAPLLIDFYSSGELDAVMTTLQIVQEYGTAVIGDMDEAVEIALLKPLIRKETNNVCYPV
nr:MAG TPA: hypothetical protein [Caudoviricetes sp.]